MKKIVIFFFISFVFSGIASTGSSDPLPRANVISVKTRGVSGSYQFSVEIQSPDKGCAQFANWWEVLSESGKLLYRRILFHSHVQEQPFVRSGGPVAITETDVVWIRAHMHPQGYGGEVFKGTVKNGFQKQQKIIKFASNISKLPPQPDGCAF